jgi:tRNA modification GTPase
MLSDPIVALATPAGRSALAVIRLSGESAFAVARRVIADFQESPARHVRLAGFVAADGSAIDRGVYTVFAGPASYTGEDMVEFSTHGGLLAPAALLRALYAAGARPAAPGEFTRRAVLHGKLDLIQAEAVGDLIDATAPAQAKVAINQLDGALSRRLEQLRSSLIEIQALLSYSIDFPEEDDGPVPVGRIARAVDDGLSQVERLLRTAPSGQRVREGALVVIGGRPNAGKSSLFNALVGIDRVLVSEIPGTTRDAVECFTDFVGWPIRLVDTAGLGEFLEKVDRMGVDVSRRYLGAADLVLLCVESGRELDQAERDLLNERVLLLRTKADLAGSTGQKGIPVSVVTGEGLERVREETAQKVFGDRIELADMEPSLTRERHRERLLLALHALELARAQVGGQGDPVLASHHVRDATTELDELIGTVDIEAVLDRVFASFCIGK